MTRLIKLLFIIQLFLSCSDTTTLESTEPQTPEDLIAHSDEFKKECLGEIPIDPNVGKTGDEGMPIVESDPSNEVSKIYLNFANKIKSTYL